MTKQVRRHLCSAGYSIPAAAKLLGFGEGTFRRAIDRGEVKVVEFGGLRRITDAEIARIRDLFGIAHTPDRDRLQVVDADKRKA